MAFSWKQQQPASLPKEVRQLLDIELDAIKQETIKSIQGEVERLTNKIDEIFNQFSSDIQLLRKDIEEWDASSKNLESKYVTLKDSYDSVKKKSNNWEIELKKSRNDYDMKNSKLNERLLNLEKSYSDQNKEIINLLRNLVQDSEGNIIHVGADQGLLPPPISKLQQAPKPMIAPAHELNATHGVSKGLDLAVSGNSPGTLWVVREQYKKFDSIFNATRDKIRTQSDTVVYLKAASDLNLTHSYKRVVYMSHFFGTQLGGVDLEFLTKISELANGKAIGVFYIRQDDPPSLDIRHPNATLYFLHFNESSGLRPSRYNNDVHTRLSEELSQ